MAIIPFKPRGERGKTGHSWMKHELAERVAAAQAAAFRAHKMLLIDANAGDGEGVPVGIVQQDLFIAEVLSRPTPEILTNVAASIDNAEVVLCEMSIEKRKALWKKFPNAKIVEHQREAPNVVRDDHRYALWLSDPCGYKDHGIRHMRAVAKRVPTDFVIILNDQALKRVSGVKESDSPWATSRKLYLSRLDPQWWREELGKRYVARSHLIDQSENFRFRIMVIADYLSEVCFHHPFTEIYSASGVCSPQQLKESQR